MRCFWNIKKLITPECVKFLVNFFVTLDSVNLVIFLHLLVSLQDYLLHIKNINTYVSNLFGAFFAPGMM